MIELQEQLGGQWSFDKTCIHLILEQNPILYHLIITCYPCQVIYPPKWFAGFIVLSLQDDYSIYGPDSPLKRRREVNINYT